MPLTYFEHDIFSNSFLTVLKEKIKNKDLQRVLPKDPVFYKFGKEFEDVLQYEIQVKDEMIPRMVKVVRAHSFYQAIMSHPEIKIQKEYFEKLYDLNFKCRTDIIIPGYLVADIKSTNAKSSKAFLKSIDFFDYDRQIYVYMTMTKCPNGAFIACSKQKHPQVFIISVKIGDEIYMSGKRKTEEIIPVLKSLM